MIFCLILGLFHVGKDIQLPFGEQMYSEVSTNYLDGYTPLLNLEKESMVLLNRRK